MQHPMLPGAWGEQPHKTTPHIQKPLRQFPKHFKLFFQRFLHLFYAREGIVWD